jgi:hypothetical protein
MSLPLGTIPRLRDIEAAFAAEAEAHARAAIELNPHGEAEALELGNARAVYAGQWSSVHGVYGLGLEGPVEERDFQEIQRFFQRKERSPAFWLTPETDPSLAEFLKQGYEPSRRVAVHGLALPAFVELPVPGGSSQPDHQAWSLAFTRVLDPGANQPGLAALTKLHQRDTRFYLGALNGASYTYFRNGVALVPVPSAHTLLSLQAKEAGDFKCSFFATGAQSPLPLLYERTLYERL